MNQTRRWHHFASVLLMALISMSGSPSLVFAQSARTSVGDLPLTWVGPSAPAAGVTAVLLTGDGGWAELIRSVANGLAAQGIPVVGFNSRTWLSTARSPQSTAESMVRVIRAALSERPSDRIVLVGYSRGADFVPFIANRLPPDLSARVAGLAMFGMAPMASFEFHWSDLVSDTRRPTDVAILPELEKLRGTHMVCVYGADEETSGCRDAPADLITKDRRKGGHHFDGNCDALVRHIVDLLAPGTDSAGRAGTTTHGEFPPGPLCPVRH